MPVDAAFGDQRTRDMDTADRRIADIGFGGASSSLSLSLSMPLGSSLSLSRAMLIKLSLSPLPSLYKELLRERAMLMKQEREERICCSQIIQNEFLWFDQLAQR